MYFDICNCFGDSIVDNVADEIASGMERQGIEASS